MSRKPTTRPIGLHSGLRHSETCFPEYNGEVEFASRRAGFNLTQADPYSVLCSGHSRSLCGSRHSAPNFEDHGDRRVDLDRFTV